MEGCWLVAAPGRACCGCWLVAALGTGACLLGAAPRDGCCWLGRGACVLLRDVPVTCRAWGSVSRALGPIDVCRAEPSISLRRGRLVSSASEAWLQPHETSRRGLRRGSEPCFDAELHIERRAWRCARG